MLTTKEILTYFSLISNGDVKEILNLLYAKPEIDEKKVHELVATVKAKTLTIIDKDYPEYLKKIPYPPIVLYYYGDITLLYDDQINISVVGSREVSKYGNEITRKIVSGLSKKMNIVSGMARGVDGIAHETALENKGKTIAVLGSGIDYCYPKSNLDLYKKIKAKGLLISEYPNDLAPQQWWFVSRNRLIAAFSKALVVTEAKIQSGTAITVDCALVLGKDIFCVPHLAGTDSGCNAIIRDGGFLVESAEDIFYYTDCSEKFIKAE